jgi:hypothetical protein
VKQPIGVPLGRELQPDIDQRSQSRVGCSQILGLFRECAVEQPKVRTIEFHRERRGAVHHRHEHVSNHQIGRLGVDGGQSLAAIRRLLQPVSLITQDPDQDFPVG